MKEKLIIQISQTSQGVKYGRECEEFGGNKTSH